MEESSIVPAQQVQRSVNVLLGMVEEGRLAEACSFLYYMHKMHIAEWVAVKRELLRKIADPKSLQTIATLLEASKRCTLQESAHFVPGLGALVYSNYDNDPTK